MVGGRARLLGMGRLGKQARALERQIEEISALAQKSTARRSAGQEKARREGYEHIGAGVHVKGSRRYKRGLAERIRSGQHGRLHIPDRGFCIAFHGGSYEACYHRKGTARRAAQDLADATRRSVDLVQVQNRGNDRFVIEEIEPR